MSHNFLQSVELNDEISNELFFHLENKKVFNQLLTNNADINYINQNGWNILFESIVLGLKEKVIELIDLGVDINMRDFKGRNALFWAIFHRQYEIVEVLLKNKIVPIVSNNLTALSYATYKDDKRTLQILLENNININSTDKNNTTSLTYAILNKRFESIEFLLKNGANVNHKDLYGNTPYSLAIELDNQYILRMLNKAQKETK